MTSILRATDGQIDALGLLAVHGDVWVSETISRKDLRQLESIGLCNADHELDGFLTDTVRWVITDKLSALLDPYQKMIKAYKTLSDDSEKIKNRIHLYWRSTSYYDGKPSGIDEKEQMDFVRGVNESVALLATMRREIGAGLAVNWFQWLYEVYRDNLSR